VTAVLLAVGASVSWGFGDFYGPLKGRIYGVLPVLLLGQTAGLAGIAILVALHGEGPASPEVLLAIPGAFAGSLGLVAFYRGMAVGAISVVAPIAGVSAGVPVLIGIAAGDRPSAAQLLGILVALVGVAAASYEPSPAGGGRLGAGVGLALLAALGFGLYFVPMHAAGEADALWATLVFRITSTSLLGFAALVARPSLRIRRPDLAVVALAGILDMTGNLLFAASASYGLLSVTAVLASLYPVVTIVLAHAVLHERTAPTQRAGIAGTLLGVALIAAG
jgi:drug/metabolite transporter (DMT)-like permease